MTLIFTRLDDAVDINGIPIEQNWKATDELTGVSISKNYPIAATQASIEADLTALFPANPVVNKDKLETLRVFRVGNSYKIVDENGKPLLAVERDTLGNASVDVIDTNGNSRRVLTPQAGTIKMDAVATTADVTFSAPFDEHPVVNMTSSKPLPNYDLKVNKQGFTLDFAIAPAGTIAYEARSNKK